MKTGVIWDKRYTFHEMGFLHPESPKRLLSIGEMLNSDGVGRVVDRLEPREATFDEILLIHNEHYVKRIEGTDGLNQVHLDADTSTNKFSWQSAKLAVGGTLVCVDQVWSEKTKNAFAFIRPPGHHAEKDRSMGFCLFNNLAIAAEWLIKEKGLERIAIVDFDVHHGNGIQHAFYDRDDVFYVSTHRYPFFPGTGSADEQGAGRGKGFNLNIPMEGGADDDDYLRIYDKKVFKALEKYEPQIILVSAGYDSHKHDPLGGMKMTTGGFQRLMEILVSAAKDLCKGKMVCVLEGGYDLKALRDSIEGQLEVMVEG